MRSQLNAGQLDAFNQIMQSVNEPSAGGRQFFLDGPGGTGKTFFHNTLINTLVGQGKTVIVVASTGIAATLLLNATTFHLRFKLYPPITDTTVSKIYVGSFEAKLIRQASLIIWDEATMTSCHALNAAERLFRDIMGKPGQPNISPFGGKVLVMSGDFRQCLPVVRHGNQVHIVEATIKSCPTWPNFRQLRLAQNMRTDAGSQEFADWLIQLGDGTLPTVHPTSPTDCNFVELPGYFLIESDGNGLMEHVFGGGLSSLHPENEETTT